MKANIRTLANILTVISRDKHNPKTALHYTSAINNC